MGDRSTDGLLEELGRVATDPGLYRKLRNLGASHEQAREAMQTAVVRVMPYLPKQIHFPASHRTAYFWRTTINCLFDLFRQQGREVLWSYPASVDTKQLGFCPIGRNLLS